MTKTELETTKKHIHDTLSRGKKEQFSHQITVDLQNNRELILAVEKICESLGISKVLQFRDRFTRLYCFW